MTVRLRSRDVLAPETSDPLNVCFDCSLRLGLATWYLFCCPVQTPVNLTLRLARIDTQQISALAIGKGREALGD
jgi:hypothetical protein